MHNMPHSKEARLRMSNSHIGTPCLHKRRETIIKNGETLYRCSSCGKFKPYSEFYKNKRTILGIKSSCKKCHCIESVRTRNKEKARDKNREYERISRQINPEKNRERWRKRKRKNDKKEKARDILNKAVKTGIILKPDICAKCGRAIKLTAHHDNYDEPLKVEWLCYECHGKLHRKDNQPRNDNLRVDK